MCRRCRQCRRFEGHNLFRRCLGCGPWRVTADVEQCHVRNLQNSRQSKRAHRHHLYGALFGGRSRVGICRHRYRSGRHRNFAYQCSRRHFLFDRQYGWYGLMGSRLDYRCQDVGPWKSYCRGLRDSYPGRHRVPAGIVNASDTGIAAIARREAPPHVSTIFFPHQLADCISFSRETVRANSKRWSPAG